MRLFFAIIVFSFSLGSCAQSSSREGRKEVKAKVPKDLDSLQTAYFASGCFWCVEAVYESVEGVVEAVSGYAGGKELNPTYEQVSYGRTGHAETVKVFYDSSVVSFSTLVDVFFNSHDPSTLNQQGPDKGTQYRSIAFYQNDDEKKVIEEKIASLLTSKTFRSITTEVTLYDTFWEAEDYHQDYERNHPENGYVQAVSIPRLNAFKKKMPEVLKKNH